MLEGIEVKRRRRSHIFEREDNDFYVEPQWCSTRLFEVEKFVGKVWDPAAGIGRIKAAAELRVELSDICPRVSGILQHDFLRPTFLLADNIVTNPPFDLSRQFAEQALRLATRKVAMIFPTRRLNAASWLEVTPLARVWLMTPRPSMGPGRLALQGIEARGDTKDYCWLVWIMGHEETPQIKWLRRDD
jgi:hypothetical protein